MPRGVEHFLGCLKMLVWVRNILFLLGRFEGTHGSHMTTEGVTNVEVVVVRPGKKATGRINGKKLKKS